MTEKEFENLKVGDKVWIVSDWFNETYGDYQAIQLEVKGTECSEFGEDKLVIYAKGRAFRYCDCYLTRSEAWQNEIETMEAIIKAEEGELNEKREKLDRYKAELAKAKEEEESWGVDFNNGRVFKTLNDVMYLDNRKWGYKTEQEAYEALAEYYKGKYEEALAKACDVRYCVSDKVIMFHDCCEAGKSDSDGEFYVRGKDYEGYDYCVKKSSCFPTRQEAEAELERRKK